MWTSLTREFRDGGILRRPSRRGSLAAALVVSACGGGGSTEPSAIEQQALIAQGQQIFRFETFGDEAQWTDTLRLHEVIAAAVDPTTAMSVCAFQRS